MDLFTSLYGEHVDNISIGSATEIQPKVFLTIDHCIAPHKGGIARENCPEQPRVEKKIARRSKLRSGLVVRVPHHPIYLIFKKGETFYGIQVIASKKLYPETPDNLDVPVLLFISAAPDKILNAYPCNPPMNRVSRIEPKLSILFSLLAYKDNAFDVITIEWKVEKALIFRQEDRVPIFDLQGYPGMSGGLVGNRKGEWLGVLSAGANILQRQYLYLPSQHIDRVQAALREANYQFSTPQENLILLDEYMNCTFKKISSEELKITILNYLLELSSRR